MTHLSVVPKVDADAKDIAERLERYARWAVTTPMKETMKRAATLLEGGGRPDEDREDKP